METGCCGLSSDKALINSALTLVFGRAAAIASDKLLVNIAFDELLVDMLGDGGGGIAVLRVGGREWVAGRLREC